MGSEKNNHKNNPALHQVKITACFYINFRKETSEQGVLSNVNANSPLSPEGSSVGMASHGLLQPSGVAHPG